MERILSWDVRARVAIEIRLAVITIADGKARLLIAIDKTVNRRSRRLDRAVRRVDVTRVDVERRLVDREIARCLDNLIVDARIPRETDIRHVDSILIRLLTCISRLAALRIIRTARLD